MAPPPPPPSQALNPLIHFHSRLSAYFEGMAQWLPEEHNAVIMGELHEAPSLCRHGVCAAADISHTQFASLDGRQRAMEAFFKIAVSSANAC